MVSQPSTSSIDRGAIKKLMAGRMAVVEDLASQLDKWHQAKAAEQSARDKTTAEAAAARAIWDKALANGWTARELGEAGLKPPAAHRAPRASSGSDQPGADASE
jgi:hypothetical protein